MVDYFDVNFYERWKIIPPKSVNESVESDFLKPRNNVFGLIVDGELVAVSSYESTLDELIDNYPYSYHDYEIKKVPFV